MVKFEDLLSVQWLNDEVKEILWLDPARETCQKFPFSKRKRLKLIEDIKKYLKENCEGMSRREVYECFLDEVTADFKGTEIPLREIGCMVDYCHLYGDPLVIENDMYLGEDESEGCVDEDNEPYYPYYDPFEDENVFYFEAYHTTNAWKNMRMKRLNTNLDY